MNIKYELNTELKKGMVQILGRKIDEMSQDFDKEKASLMQR